jgi:threonine dehydratase
VIWGIFLAGRNKEVSMNYLSLDKFESAREILRQVIVPTPLQSSRSFSEMTDCTIHLKPECLQRNGSQKVRGAYYVLSRFSDEDRRAGVCTFSSGNWAQGVACAGTRLKIPVTVIMREDSNPKKVAATKAYGGQVILHGHGSNDLAATARRVAHEKNMVLINPFENPDMMIGLGTIGLEIVEEMPDVEDIIVPLGGGGMIVGISTAVKHIRKDVRVYGVEPEGANAVHRSLQAGRVIQLADGLAVQRPDEGTFKIIQKSVDDVILVSDSEIKEAIFLLLERAGAVSLAAVLKKRIPNMVGRKVAVLLSGGNINFHLLRKIIAASN